MASIASACRVSARVAGRQLRNHGASRGFRTSTSSLVAHNFPMPALSPTMTEGNIASWKVKEGTAQNNPQLALGHELETLACADGFSGDSFSAGDVLLEVETDKAQMDVEAQDDGIMAKITQGDGSKGVKVGVRIAVLADPGDDISSLEIPPEEDSAPKAADSKEASEGQARRKDRPSPQEETASGIDPTESSPSSAEGPPSSKPNADASAGGAADTAGKGKDSADASKASSGGEPQKQKYPLYPAVQHLIHENGLSMEDAAKIPATGPNGRLLKGDVLAYLGRIEKSYAAELSKRIAKMGHLDLSNIKIAEPKKKEPEKAKPAAAEAALPVAEPDLEIAMPISLRAVLDCQRRVKDSIGVFLPLSTFIARASELANDNLPRSKASKPTADELFNAVLGLDKVGKTSRGHFVPLVTVLPPTPLASKTARKTPDIFDILSGKAIPARPAKARAAAPPLAGAVPPADLAAINVFSVMAPKGDERRARVFLERVKGILEAEPGRLVL
ncbi:pre-tRNA nuclear export protein [Coniosporium tulheliwenetii]|uniref:Pre-tRNA nuclear export protein n=1 Tax=Coniosporium tulheliwenetii TaxID=3383036 RepID=A0ACC2Z871_9PEZI|nr:pre-tRNA nuclear export protein [Cladosporium sp. JES 115]